MPRKSRQPDFLFIKLQHDFPEHPKVAGLSDRAFRNLVELWCLCSRFLTDGMLTEAQVRRATTPKTRRELSEAGLLVTVEKSYEMHDYLDYQRSAQEVADLREQRREAGSRGGKRQASAQASAKQTPSKNQAEIEIEIDTSTDVEVVVAPARKPKARATSRPEGFAPNDTHHAIAIRKGLDLMAEFAKWGDWCEANGRTYVDWNAGLRTWLNNAKPEQQQRQTRQQETDGIFNRAAQRMGVTGDPRGNPENLPLRQGLPSPAGH